MSRFERILRILKSIQEVLGIALVTIDIVRPMATQVFEDLPKPVPPQPITPKQFLKTELQRGLGDVEETEEDLDLFLRR